MNKEYITLWKALDIIKSTFDHCISDQIFLIESEINKINKYNNFYYLDLVEINSWQIIEIAKWNIFNSRVVDEFLSETKLENINDILWKKILLTVRPSFHKRYWFSFNIIKIDSWYYLWKLANDKLKNIEKLKELWIFDNNRKYSLWFPPYKIAVITWNESEWFKDFDTILKDSWYNIEIYKITSLVHWEKAAWEVTDNLKLINNKDFDLIAIVRWGWWSDWMNWTNNFELNKIVCELEIPLMTAIWHTIDNNIIDLISRYPCKTPSEAANIIINLYKDVDNDINEYYKNINKKINYKIDLLKNDLSYINNNIKTSIRLIIKNYKLQLNSYLLIDKKIRNIFSEIKNKLNNFNLIIKNNNPDKIISKWYSIIYNENWEIVSEYNEWEKYIMVTDKFNYSIRIESKNKR